MPLSARSVDPLHSFMAATGSAAGAYPIPLVATLFDVRVDAGLATVSTSRTFRNDERNSIEAAITFPVPVHAVLFSLEARLNGCVLKARARRKVQAREAYEDALERGKTAILHEEVLRGVHMLSAGHIPPGAEIKVIAVWAMPLTNIHGVGRLRIPLTIGDVYGHSGLPASDELIHGGPVQSASLTVECADGTVLLNGASVEGGRAEIPLNAPIDLQVTAWTSRVLRGRAADGRDVTLEIEPVNAGKGALNVAVAIDHSGSMQEAVGIGGTALNKHQAVVSGLRRIGENLRAADVLDLWEFDNALRHIGTANDARSLSRLIRALAPPVGGTEIGTALGGIVAQSAARDVLLITDGKSYALDVQAVARTGKRFSVVLIGEDSLEANVGYLAALTGGDIFIAAGADVTETIMAAMDTFRSPSDPVRASGSAPDAIDMRRGNMRLQAEWQAGGGETSDAVQARAVACVAAALLLPSLDTEAATQLAEAEGLVTHLTSLVLVDESATQEGIPAMRKIALPSPRTMAMPAPPPVAAVSMAGEFNGVREHALSQVQMSGSGKNVARSRGRFALLDGIESLRRGLDSRNSARQEPNIVDTDTLEKHRSALAALAGAVDWDAAPNRLHSGDLSSLDADVALKIRQLASAPDIVALAGSLHLDPIVFVIGLIALSAGGVNRSAGRLAKSILKGRVPAMA